MLTKNFIEHKIITRMDSIKTTKVKSLVSVSCWTLIFISTLVGYVLTELGIIFFLAIILLFYLFYLTDNAFGYPRKRQIELSNRSLPEAISNISIIIKNAKSNVTIVSGWLDHKLFDSLSVLNSFKFIEAGIKSGEIKVDLYITNNEIDPETKNFRNFLKDNRIGVRKVPASVKLNHCIVVDSRDVRLEDKHELSADERKALLHFSNPHLAAKVIALIRDIEMKNEFDYVAI